MTPIHLALALAPVVPEIVRWIAGGDSKAAETAQKVVGVAESLTGKIGMDAVQAVKADPQALLAFRSRVMEMDMQLEVEHLKDRQDARSRDVELAKSGFRNERADAMVRIAAIGTLGGFIGMLLLGLLKAHYPESINEGVFGALLAQLATITSFFGLCLRDAYQFEFGSSRGSVTKGDQQAEMMAELAKGMKK